jgi:hypothetical protein
MIPTVVKMVEAEDPARIEHFVKKTLGLCVYILEGEGGELLVQSQEMPREDADESQSDGPDRLRGDQPEGAGEGLPAGRDGLGEDDAGGVSDSGLLESLRELSDPDPRLEAEI